MPETTTSPATKPATHPCQLCDGTGVERHPGRTCSRCDGIGQTTEYDCGCCCETFDVGAPWHAESDGGRMQTPRLVSYVSGDRRHYYCANCAPLVAVGDGAHLRDLIDKTRHLICELSKINGPRAGFATGYAKEIEAGLLEIATWSGVAPTWRDLMPAAEVTS